MKIKCLHSFVGAVTGQKGKILDVPEAMAKDLINAGYVITINESKIKSDKDELVQATEPTKPKSRKKVKD